jgi:hypothetical protein
MIGSLSKRRNYVSELEHNTIQKVNVALHMMAYCIPIDLVDDHLAMGESVCHALCNSGGASVWW